MRRHAWPAAVAALLMAGAVLLAILGWSASGRGPAASLQIDPTDWDFGVVSLGQAILTHSFPIRNAGSDPIELRMIGASCNCLSVKCPETLGPGESGGIQVEVEVRRREGRFATSAVVETSDPAAPVVRLTLRFYGEPAILVDPPFVKLDDVGRGEVVRREFRVVRTIRDEQQALGKVPEIHCPSKAIAWTHLGQQILPGPAGDPELKHLEDRYAISFDTSLTGDEPLYATAMTIVCPGVLESSRKEVAFGIQAGFRHHPSVWGPMAVTLRRGGTSQVRLTAREAGNLCITRVTSPLQGLQHAWEPKTAAPHQLLALTLGPAAGAGSEIERTFVDVYFEHCPKSPYRLSAVVLPGAGP